METAKGRVIKFRAWTGTEMIYEGFHISAPGIAWSWVDFTATDSKVLGFPVMQYTGLLDKNGVEIYEGDICTKMISPDENNRAPKELYRGEITYHFGGFCLKVDDYYYPMSRTHGVVDVIGNIYQNPELLNQ